MSATIALSVDAKAGFDRVAGTFGRLPQATERAQARALRKLSTWLGRQVLKAASQASGIPQKFFQKALRHHVRLMGKADGVTVWIGTNPIPVHRLGSVRWNPRMTGARVGRKSYPHAWSWGRGKTRNAVMRRTGDSRLPIERVEEKPHAAVLKRLQALQAEALARFDALLRQELNYALNVEARA
jgi:hypothetical protein